MTVHLRPTEEQRFILERLQVPEDIAALLRQPSLALEVQEAETVRAALTDEMARRGFDADYRPNDEGRVIEVLIDALFIP